MPTMKRKSGAAKKAPAKGKTMLISDIDPAVWTKFQMRAASEGRRINWLFHDFIGRYAGGQKQG